MPIRYRLYRLLALLLLLIYLYKEVIIDFIIELPLSKINRVVYNIILIVVY
jgi:hypothetical protein